MGHTIDSGWKLKKSWAQAQWDFQSQTQKLLLVSQADTVNDKKQKSKVVKDPAILSDNHLNREHEKILEQEAYRKTGAEMKEEIQKLWKQSGDGKRDEYCEDRTEPLKIIVTTSYFYRQKFREKWSKTLKASWNSSKTLLNQTHYIRFYIFFIFDCRLGCGVVYDINTSW